MGVFVGFDVPRTLGSRDTGGVVAAPIFRDFMYSYLKNKPSTPFRVPSGIKFIRVNHKTGLPAKVVDEDVILEAFKPEDNFSNSKNIDSDGEESNLINNQVEDNVPDVGGIY
ncbi:MAG: hypothetical protein BWY78_00350 [Alphaproteobacteria bacterium ADurb.Bin438]|nr:MAG: hypothetical protein BWY78_00350 [Alphaproteobacteria bacterium ADurb.Bin438]